MKTKLLSGLSLLLFLSVILIVYLKSNQSPSRPLGEPSSNKSLPPDTTSAFVHKIVAAKKERRSEDPTSLQKKEITSVATDLAEIEKLMDERDSKVVTSLLGKMHSPSKEIRQAALDGIMLIDDSSAAPELRKIAAIMRDPQESAAIIHSADFLELPPAKLNFKSPSESDSSPDSHL
jgi:hypothetical protein